MLTGEVMMELGHDVVASGQPRKLEALAREPFDVLLTDVGLAGMSGIDPREAVTRHPRLSVVIASATPSTLRTSASSGCAPCSNPTISTVCASCSTAFALSARRYVADYHVLVK